MRYGYQTQFGSGYVYKAEESLLPVHIFVCLIDENAHGQLHSVYRTAYRQKIVHCFF